MSQQEIDSVQTVYFTQEEYKEENKSEYTGTVADQVRDDQIAERQSTAFSYRENRMLQAYKRSGVNLAAVDQQTIISKTSIQMMQFQEQVETQHSIPLVHTELSKVQLYAAPLKDKD